MSGLKREQHLRNREACALSGHFVLSSVALHNTYQRHEWKKFTPFLMGLMKDEMLNPIRLVSLWESTHTHKTTKQAKLDKTTLVLK